MVTRIESGRRKQALVRWLREAIHSGQLRPGEMTPTARELGERFGLSLRVVALEIQALVAEGLLHTVPRQGTYVGRSACPSDAVFLLALGSCSEVHGDLLRIGFEERIAQLGGSTLTLTLDEAVLRRQRNDLPVLAGIFDHSEGRPRSAWGIERSLPRVSFHAWIEDALHADVLAFDDQGGGWQATQTLIAQGCRRIAYLGQHPEPNAERVFLWSEARHMGWRAACTNAGLAVDGLAFQPRHLIGYSDAEQIATAHETAKDLIRVPGLDAVVAANDCAALGLCRALTDASFPREQWPAIIGFDGSISACDYVLTSLRPPWETLGRTAADFLWDRHSDTYRGQPRTHLVPMRLIHRVGVRGMTTGS
jgi:DNA-binding LacI/PurR family transcriptional regulator